MTTWVTRSWPRPRYIFEVGASAATSSAELLSCDPGASLTAIQAETLGLVRALADEGLFLIGDLTGTGGRFVAWTTSPEGSLQRISSEYVERYDNKDTWPWYCWLDLTAEGDRVAHAIEAKLNQASDTITGA